MDAIAESETRLCPVVRSLLEGPESTQVLSCRQLKPQASTEGVRGKSADLIYLSEILSARCKQQVS
jgi:hypothetical protein